MWVGEGRMGSGDVAGGCGEKSTGWNILYHWHGVVGALGMIEEYCPSQG